MRECRNCLCRIDHKRPQAVYCSIPCKKAHHFQQHNKSAEFRAKSKSRAKKWREENKEQAVANVKRWHEDNKDRSSYHKAAYHYRKMDATPDYINVEDLAGLHTLCRKLEELTPMKYHVDHIVPLKGGSICGLNVPWNLQILPAHLNIAKRNRVDYRPFSRLGKAGSIYYDPNTTILAEESFDGV